jgi:hypothetical protein
MTYLLYIFSFFSLAVVNVTLRNPTIIDHDISAQIPLPSFSLDVGLANQNKEQNHYDLSSLFFLLLSHWLLVCPIRMCHHVSIIAVPIFYVLSTSFSYAIGLANQNVEQSIAY